MTVPVAQRLLAAASGQTLFNEAAHAMWLAAIAQLLESLRSPACTRLLGPLVPGATMAGGARVPGTSYDLDPAQAAFNASLLVEWTSAEAVSALPAERPEQLLVALLAVADYRSRRALAYGESPWSVRDVTTLLSRLGTLRAALAFGAQEPPVTAALVRLRAACAVGAALLCNADEPQCRTALQLAAVTVHPLGPDLLSGSGRPLLLADAAAQGVRLGLLAMRAGDAAGDISHPWQAALTPLFGPAEPVPGIVERLSDPEPAAIQAALPRVESAVTLHFPVVQADRIRSALADRDRLATLGVHELLALLMRN